MRHACIAVAKHCGHGSNGQVSKQECRRFNQEDRNILFRECGFLIS